MLGSFFDTYGTRRDLRHLVAYALTVALVGIAAAATVVNRLRPPKELIVWVYVILGLIDQHLIVTLPTGRFMTLGDPITFAALWCCGPAAAILALIPGNLVQYFTKKRGLLNCLFNAGQLSLAVLAANASLTFLSGRPWSDTGVGQIIAMAMMVLVFDLVNTLFLAGAISLDYEEPWFRVFWRILVLDRQHSLVFWYVVNVSSVLLAQHTGISGTIFIFIGVIALWTQRKFEQALAEKSREAETDGLTGLLNVRYLDDWVNAEPCRDSREDCKYSLVFVDVDGLKQVNDSHGHDAGNALLVQLSAILRSAVRAEDKVVRYGGDEFVLICMATGPDAAAAIGQRILGLIKSTPLIHEGISLAYGVSVGVASYPKHGLLGRDLIRLADKAMYLAKRQGGNRVFTADVL